MFKAFSAVNRDALCPGIERVSVRDNNIRPELARTLRPCPLFFMV